MVPAALVILDSLPVTENGKVDRNSLPEPDWRAGLTFAEPRTPVELALAAIWARMLNLDRVGVNDSFFELGGHSLSLMQVLHAIKSASLEGIDVQAVTIVDLFRYPTIAQFVARFTGSKAQVRVPQTPAVRRKRASVAKRKQRAERP
jgi:hypothetical protein